MSDSKRREHICFTGYVQGVGFRYRLSHLAQYYGVTGWVRNEYDGSVSAELQGLPEEIDQIIQQLQQDRYIEIPGYGSKKNFDGRKQQYSLSGEVLGDEKEISGILDIFHIGSYLYHLRSNCAFDRFRDELFPDVGRDRNCSVAFGNFHFG